jgi:hypothetical protein
LSACDARDSAEETYRRQPLALIRWRNYSHIGDVEIDGARQRFLADGHDKQKIEKEYADAKKRYRSAVKAALDWEKRVGVDALSKSMEQARAEFYAAREALAVVKLESVADASAILKVVHTNLKEFGELDDWEKAALNNASKFLDRAVAGAALA